MTETLAVQPEGAQCDIYPDCCRVHAHNHTQPHTALRTHLDTPVEPMRVSSDTVTNIYILLHRSRQANELLTAECTHKHTSHTALHPFPARRTWPESLSQLRAVCFNECVCVCVCLRHHGIVLETQITAEAVLSILYLTWLSLCPWTEFWQSNSITTVQDTVIKLHMCVVEIKIIGEFEDGRGPPDEHWVIWINSIKILSKVAA